MTKTPVQHSTYRLANGKLIHTLRFPNGSTIDFGDTEVMAAYMLQHNLEIAI